MTAICPVDWRRHTDPSPVSGTRARSTPAARYSSTQAR